MAYYEFTGTAPQTQNVRQLKQSLITARNLAENLQRQNSEMTLAQMQEQFGVDIALTEEQWEATVNDIMTALDSVQVTNLISKVGFSV